MTSVPTTNRVLLEHLSSIPCNSETSLEPYVKPSPRAVCGTGHLEPCEDAGMTQLDLSAIYRDLHQHPELAFTEHRTASVVAHALRDLGLTPRTGIGGTGVVADIVRGSGKVIALRADMDALPILEQTGLAYSSQHDGIMHACGHDAHTTMLLGAAQKLVQSNFSGTVRLVFQPAEEGYGDDAARQSGAQKMLEAGVYDGVSAALALHNIPQIPLGQLGVCDAEIMGCCLDFRITVRGVSAHAGAEPERGVDAILIGSSIVVTAQSLVSRTLAALEAGIVSFGVMSGGKAENIVADELILRGTIRTLKDSVAFHLRDRLEQLASNVAAAHGGTTEFYADPLLPSTYNDPAVNAAMRVAAQDVGLELLEISASLGVEDFAYVSHTVPSAYAMIGAGVVGTEQYGLHHAQVRCNEDVLPLGAALLAGVALRLLGGNAERRELIAES